MTTAVRSARCGPYEIVAQHDGTLLEREDDGLELLAEARYLIRLGEGADRDALRGALTVLVGAEEGLLQFGNFIGETRLGGRRLVIRSSRLTAPAVAQMLEEVSEQLRSLPFFADTPTFAPYARERVIGPDALYHAYAFLRDGLNAGGGHDLPGAIERILARPHESLRIEEPRLIPLGRADRVDPAMLAALSSEPELLRPIPPGSPLEPHPLARRLGGWMPELIRTRPLRHSTDNRENRFVVSALEVMSDIARQFERFARSAGRPSSAMNISEAHAIAARLDRWRRHPVLDPLAGRAAVPIHSTVLRGRAGYRELLRFYIDLMSRTALTEPHDLRSLLELRDAAEIYEYWCYFRVVGAVAAALGASPKLSRFAAQALGTRVPYGYRAQASGVDVLYNLTFSRPARGAAQVGHHSYSVRLRPDITVITPDGGLHLFDAKLKVDFTGAVNAEDADPPAGPTETFKREDLYKMHAYRDALGADSVWVLYPGSRSAPDGFRVPWETGGPTLSGFRGVGAIALRPGAGHDGGLLELVRAILGAGGAVAARD